MPPRLLHSTGQGLRFLMCRRVPCSRPASQEDAEQTLSVASSIVAVGSSAGVAWMPAQFPLSDGGLILAARRPTREKDLARYADAEPLHNCVLTIRDKSGVLTNKSEGAPLAQRWLDVGFRSRRDVRATPCQVCSTGITGHSCSGLPSATHDPTRK
jgi:hypothetical protein